MSAIAELTGLDSLVKASVEPGQRWADNEPGIVTVLYVHHQGRQGWAWLKRHGRNPFTASVNQMLRGDYGWRLVE